MKNPLLPLCCVLLFTASFVAQTSHNEPNPKALTALTKGQFAEAIAILDKDIRNEKNLFASYRFRSDLKLMTGDLPGALADVSSAIAIKSDDAKLYERRAEIRSLLRHDMKDVLADLDSAIAHGGKHEGILVQRGNIRSRAGDYDGAISDLREAIVARPNFANAYVSLAAVYRRQNDVQTAIKVLEEFVAGIEERSEPTKPVNSKTLIITGIELENSQPSDLRSGMQSVITIDGERVSRRPSPDQMRAIADRTEQTKNTALAYTTLADLYERSSRLDAAWEMVAKGLALDPSVYYGYAVRGKIKVSKGDFNGGVEDLTRAITGFPPNPGPYLDRGIAYLLLGKDTEAQQDFDRYLEIAPGGKQLLEKRIAEAKAGKQ